MARTVRSHSAAKVRTAAGRRAVLVASGDLREEANRACWPAQQALESDLTKAFAAAGWTLARGHAASRSRGHGSSRRSCGSRGATCI